MTDEAIKKPTRLQLSCGIAETVEPSAISPERRCSSGYSFRREHITPVMRQLHWLPVRQRVMFKLATLVYHSRAGTAPAYACLTNVTLVICWSSLS